MVSDAAKLPEVLRSQCRSSAWLTGRAADR